MAAILNSMPHGYPIQNSDFLNAVYFRLGLTCTLGYHSTVSLTVPLGDHVFSVLISRYLFLGSPDVNKTRK